MPLQKQLVSVDFSGGIDTKTDEKLVVPGKLLELENGIFTKAGTIQKRFGYDAIDVIPVGYSAVTDGKKLLVYKDELLAANTSKIYSYSSSGNDWYDKGAIITSVPSVRQIIRNSYTQSNPDCATQGDVTIYAWEDGRGGVRASVLDETSSIYVQTDVSIHASATRPRCVAVGGYLFVLYIVSGTIRFQRIDPLSPTIFGVEGTFVSDIVAASPEYDVVPVYTGAIVAYHRTGELRLAYMTNAGVLGSALMGLPPPLSIAHDADLTVSLCAHSTTYDVWVYSNSTVNGLKYTVVTGDLSLVSGPTTIDSTTSPATTRVTGTTTSTTSATVFYEVTAAATYNRLIKTATTSRSGTVGTVSTLKRSVGLASRAFTSGSNQYVLTVHDSTLQPTYFLLKSDGSIVSKALSQIAGGLNTKNYVSSVFSAVSGQYVSAQWNATRIDSTVDGLFTPKGIAKVTFDFDPPSLLENAALGDNLHITGGFLSMYDGQSVVEHNFHLYPENVTTTPSGSGGSMATGTYTYYAVYAWIDNQGQLHRSTTSVGTAAAVTGPTGSVTVTIPTLRLTAKDGTRTPVMIEVYRTTSTSAATAYRLTSMSSPTYNSTTSDTVAYVDTLADASITGLEPLYTVGGILDNASAPSGSLITTFKNRLWVGGLEDGFTLGFSKERVLGEGVAFADEFRKRIDPLGGSVTAIVPLDDKLIAFKRTHIFALVGDGPTESGFQDNFSDFELINSDVGCDDPRSIVITPDGILFHSLKGIYLLNRSLQAVYKGAPVEGYNSQTYSSATMIEGKNQIRFLTSTTSGRSLVYDYFFDQWGTFTNHVGLSAVVWSGSYMYLRSDGQVFKENASSYTDDGSGYKMKCTLAWLKFAGIQGHQRIRRVYVIGDYYSNHKMRLSVRYNYESAYVEEHLWEADEVLNLTNYGSSATYGSETPYGGTYDNRYQFIAGVARQKCESIGLSFEDVSSSGLGQGYSISNIMLEVGVKQGGFKMSESRSV